MSRARVTENENVPRQEVLDPLAALERDNSRLRAGLLEVEEIQSKLEALVEKLSAPPLYPAVVLARDGSTVLVGQGTTRRIVQIVSDLDALETGDEVLLASGLNVILGKSPYRSFAGGETAAFDRYLGTRLVLKSRDEEIVVDAVGDAARCDWKPGDLARWERSLYVVTEKIPPSEGGGLWLEETPRETFDDIGGLGPKIALIRATLRLSVESVDIARKYGIRRVGCIFLYGPPGTGKTLLARAIANWLATLSADRRSRFIHVRPGQFASMWYGETERKWRECFRVAREAADRDPDVPVVIFLDEVDAVAARRGRSLTPADDRVVCAIADELNGFEDRPNVCVIAATNRPDVLDPALTRPGGRFGDLALSIPRPNREAAREILRRHLPPNVPCAVPGLAGDEARDALVDAVLSRTYAPNAAGEVARITFRDGSARAIHPADLVSGASLAQIVRSAVQAAALREVAGAAEGLRREDLLSATEEEIERSTALLTSSNIRAYVQDVPEDLDVVSVAPVRRKVRRAHQFLHVA